MAIKIDTNALVLAEIFKTTITQAKLEGWSQAAIINVLDGTYKGDFGFPYFVSRYWLSGQVMNKSSDIDPTPSFLKRGWHHRDTVSSYFPKRSRFGTKEARIGLYVPDKPGLSLNYIARNLKGGNERFMQKAWGQYKGTSCLKKELAWMFDKGLDKIFREENCAGSEK